MVLFAWWPCRLHLVDFQPVYDKVPTAKINVKKGRDHVCHENTAGRLESNNRSVGSSRFFEITQVFTFVKKLTPLRARPFKFSSKRTSST